MKHRYPKRLRKIHQDKKIKRVEEALDRKATPRRTDYSNVSSSTYGVSMGSNYGSNYIEIQEQVDDIVQSRLENLGSGLL